MLLELHIADLGVIEDVTLQFPEGLSVLTGETGAGKTMVTVALGLALGERGAAALVRDGAKAALVEARFRAPAGEGVDPALGEWVTDGEIVVSRQVGTDGRSSARVGGRMAPVGALAQLAPSLVEVHGQSEHQRLLSPSAQTRFLDRFAGADHLRELKRYRRAFENLRQGRALLAELDQAAEERARELELLAYQIREIQGVNVREGELQQLAKEESRLANAEDLAQLASEAQDMVGGDDAAAERLHRAAAALGRAGRLDSTAEDLARRVWSLAEEAADATQAIRRFRDSIEIDPNRLASVQERIAAIRELERKYGVGVKAIRAYLRDAEGKLARLEGDDERRGRTALEVDRLVDEVAELGERVRRGRQASAATLGGALQVELWSLGMEGAAVEVLVEPAEPGPEGTEKAEILFSGGAGQQLQPLRRAASGGELSRAMLACRSVLADLDEVPTLVFDEVDAGIGGRAGVTVGRRLSRIGRTRQVLVVTHLPQIACFADRQFLVTKESGRATVEALDDEARVRELSRMLAGLPSSEAASTHAEELLAEAAREKAGREVAG